MANAGRSQRHGSRRLWDMKRSLDSLNSVDTFVRRLRLPPSGCGQSDHRGGQLMARRADLPAKCPGHGDGVLPAPRTCARSGQSSRAASRRRDHGDGAMLKLCLVCSTLSHQSRCPSHRIKRPSATPRGYGSAWQRTSARVIARDGRECLLRLPGCAGTATTTDHVIPKKRGGTDDDSNLVAACRRCNSRKKDRPR